MSTLKRQLWTLRLSLGGRVLDKLAEQRAAVGLDRSTIDAMQFERLEALLRWAHEHVPYYRATLDRHDVLREGSLDLERFRALPLLDKATIRRAGSALHADDLGRRTYRLNRSGGSTGEPVVIAQDRDSQEWGVATKMLFNEWAGQRPGERTLFLWGAPRDLEASGNVRGRVGAWMRNEIMLDAFHMPAGSMKRYVRRINRFRPRLVVAYAQSLFELARFAERESLDVWSPAGIITSATTLYPHMRTTIERVFGARVVDRYGSREVGDIACEHPDDSGLFVAAPTHYVEILRPDGTDAAVGEPGEIVVTLLTNRAMPLIRYRIGDVGVWAPQDGAFGWPRLAEVSGRVTDVFPTSGGDLVYGGYFTRLLYERSWVREFQVVQEALEHLRVFVVPADDVERVPPEELRSLATEIRGVMGEACRVEIETVDAIDPTSSGKRRYTLSRVPIDAAGNAVTEGK